MNIVCTVQLPYYEQHFMRNHSNSSVDDVCRFTVKLLSPASEINHFICYMLPNWKTRVSRGALFGIISEWINVLRICKQIGMRRNIVHSSHYAGHFVESSTGRKKMKYYWGNFVCADKHTETVFVFFWWKTQKHNIPLGPTYYVYVFRLIAYYFIHERPHIIHCRKK